MEKPKGHRDGTLTIPPKDEPLLSLPDLIASYGDRLLPSAYLLGGHSINAQDIVQETFCRALAALPDFRGEACVYTWLFTIMRNVYLHIVAMKGASFIFSRANHATRTTGAARPSIVNWRAHKLNCWRRCKSCPSDSAKSSSCALSMT